MKCLTIIGLFLFSSAAFGQAVYENDLKALEGTTWTGTLTYVDYRSGNRTSIKSNLNVVKKSKNVWTFEYVYPDEPKANASSEIALTDGGKTFDGQAITMKRSSESGTLQFTATREGDDNGKKALFRYTYSIEPKAFSIRKEVQYIGESEWFERNKYSWTR